MKFELEIITRAPEQTEKIGEELAEAISSDPSLPRFVAMYGDLGVGKTAFVRGFVRPIAPSALVRSPTFALVNEYRGGGASVYHFDMYRIEGDDDLYSTGFYDYLERRGGICIAEWCEKIAFALPEEYISVRISKLSAADEDTRKITIKTIRN